MNGSRYIGYPENMPENKKVLCSLQFVWHVALLTLHSSLSSFSNKCNCNEGHHCSTL